MSSFRTIRKKIKYSLLVAAIKVLLVVIRFLPRKITMKLLGSIGALTFRLLKKERVKAISNLNIAYGNEKSQE